MLPRSTGRAGALTWPYKERQALEVFSESQRRFAARKDVMNIISRTSRSETIASAALHRGACGPRPNIRATRGHLGAIGKYRLISVVRLFLLRKSVAQPV